MTEWDASVIESRFQGQVTDEFRAKRPLQLLRTEAQTRFKEFIRSYREGAVFVLRCAAARQVRWFFAGIISVFALCMHAVPIMLACACEHESDTIAVDVLLGFPYVGATRAASASYHFLFTQRATVATISQA